MYHAYNLFTPRIQMCSHVYDSTFTLNLQNEEEIQLSYLNGQLPVPHFPRLFQK